MIDDGDVTQLLEQLKAGDRGAAERLWPLIYDDLHTIAKQHLRREQRDSVLQTTAIVHETYLRMVESKARTDWQGRAHFLAVAAQVIRRILVDWARAEKRLKRGGGMRTLALEDVATLTGTAKPDLLALDEALDRLAHLNPRCSDVIILRYFGGLRIEEVAEVLKVAPRTVNVDWQFARSWLRRELTRGAST
ncbi:MAG: ECF-type sigma factor [Planctomycetota bacterium]